MPDRVSYCFKNGFVDTGDLPCREALRAGLAARHVEKPAGPFKEIHWGLEGREVDYSTFKHRPTLVRRGFRCTLAPVKPGAVLFRISTCGGVTLWLDGARVASHEPFQRNSPTGHDIRIDLTEGDHELILLLEDLHERDTTCFFSLTHLSGPVLDVMLSAGTDPDRLREAGEVLGSLRTGAVFATRGKVSLLADRPPSAPMEIEVTGPRPFSRGGLTQDPDAPRPTRTVTLGPEAPAADLFDVADAPAGCLALDLAIKTGGVRLTRRLGVTNLPDPLHLSGPLSQRKADAASAIAAARGFEPSVAALLATRGEAAAHVARIVEATLTTIEQRYDCSDFSILPLLRLWCDAADNLSPSLRDRMRAAFLNYRYWLDAPGNDVMWFWSENHVLCFHTAQLISGTLFPDDTFPTHAKTGREMAAEAEARLIRWFDAIDRDGLCEWNSAAYYPIDFLGLFTLHDMAPSLRARARKVLDRIFVMTGLHTTGGVPAGSQGRAYEKELLAGPVTELGSVAAIAFGGDYRTGHDRAASLFCLSDYEPPDDAARFARPAPGTTLAARYTQGHGHQGKLSLWKSADVQLSTVTDLKTGQHGHQAHVLDVQFAAHPMARLWINHPGELKVWGERRPSLLAGNHVMPAVAQHGPTALMIYDLHRDWTDLHLTQIFAPPDAFDEVARHGDWLIFRAGGGQAAVWCSSSLAPVDGLYRGALHRAHGLRTGWIVALAHPRETAPDFRARLAASRPAFTTETLTLDLAAPTGQALSLTFGEPLRIDGQPRPFQPLSATPHIGTADAPLTEWKPSNA
jgi:hypothetical protein